MAEIWCDFRSTLCRCKARFSPVLLMATALGPSGSALQMKKDFLKLFIDFQRVLNLQIANKIGTAFVRQWLRLRTGLRKIIGFEVFCHIACDNFRENYYLVLFISLMQFCKDSPISLQFFFYIYKIIINHTIIM